jgi:hypothetical protein
MTTDENPEDGSEVGDVQITVFVVPGRVRATLGKFLVRKRACGALVGAGLIAAIAVGTTIALLSSGGKARQPVGSDALATQFGLRLNCSHRTVPSPDGAYARIDLDHAAPCATFGNQVTLVLHRLHGVWVREFEASRWTCPVKRLPRPVAIELQLCRSKRSVNTSGGALSKIALDH